MLYTYEHFNGEDYEYIDLDCNVVIHPPEPDVGIAFNWAEIISCVDAVGKDWYDVLDGWDKEAIEQQALEKNYG